MHYKLTLSAVGCPSAVCQVESLAEAVSVSRLYIQANRLSPREWTGGLIRLVGTPVGRVSYAGRVVAPGVPPRRH
jgi:hypothetical protein